MTYVQLLTPNLNIPYKGGWCQKASENSVGQSGVHASAYKAWLANVQHKGLPPKDLYVPIYLSMPNGPKDPQGVQEDDVAWSCPDGTIAAAAQSGTHTGLFKYPSLEAYVSDYAKHNGGATYRGWGEYVGKLQVVKGGEDMPITKEMEMSESYKATGSYPGKDYDYRFTGTTDYNGMLTFWQSQMSLIDRNMENEVADGISGVKGFIGWDGYNSLFVSKPVVSHYPAMVRFWLRYSQQNKSKAFDTAAVDKAIKEAQEALDAAKALKG